MKKENRLKSGLRALGPGLMYAGAAVGVSHLVQSTRAGAEYGYSLIWVIIVINFLKYPFFEYGPRYAAATGKNLVDGYAGLSKAALYTFTAITIGTMFTVLAAIILVTAGLIVHVTDIPLVAEYKAAILLCATFLFLMLSTYKTIEKPVKWVIIILSGATIVAAGATITSNHFSTPSFTSFDFSNQTDLFFLVALIGWMPAPIDIAVWHSVWGQEKNKNTNKRTAAKNASTDFSIGYWGTTFLAVCFLILGAGVLSGESQLPDDAVGFTTTLISLYTQTLGDWAFPVIAAAALAAMLSTTLTVADGFTRVMVPVTQKIIPGIKFKPKKTYIIWLLALCGGAWLILNNFKTGMRSLIDFITTVSFVTAPILAIFNFLVIQSREVPHHAKPGKLLRVFSIFGIAFLTLFALYFLYLRFLT